MAKMPAQFWMLKRTDADGTVHFKSATGTSATPKLYLHQKVASAAGRHLGYTAVPVSINFL